MTTFIQKPDNSFGLSDVGVASSPQFAAPQTNPFGLSRMTEGSSTPTFADIDGDGDFDAFIGSFDGNFHFFQNTGSPSNPQFAAPQKNPFSLKNFGEAANSTPTFADIDNDGDLDLFSGEQTAVNTIYYQNIGSATSPQFAAPKAFGLKLPLGSGKRIGLERIYDSAPTFADIDNDGDLDAFIGDWNGDTYFFQNTGSPSTPSFAAPQKNHFGLTQVGTTFLGANFRDSKPTFADIDKDGDLDAFIGDDDANTNFFENIGSATSPQFATPQVNPFGLSKAGAADSAPTFVDINGDGNLDAFIGDGAGDTYFFQNTAGLQFAGPQLNPFGLTPVEHGAPTFADIDNDGDLDAFIGGGDGDTYLFQNIGTASSPLFLAAQANPFSLTNVGSDSAPTFADIDNDGDLDAFIGDSQGQGNINYFENTGTASSPSFAAAVTNPFGLSTVEYGHPTFADIDNDGDLDAFIGGGNGNTYLFQNTGTASSPQFATFQTNPFGLSNVGSDSAPTFADIDNDGDLDAFIGGGNGNTYLFRNTGTASSPQFATAQLNPLGLSNVGSDSAPTFADIDNDGDLDAIIGDSQGQGNINYFENTGATPPLSGAGVQQQFAIAAGDGTVNISNFGGVGSGVNPAAAVVAEVDTLQFTGADLTPEKLLLTTLGDNLELSFEGVADTKVVLGNFALEDLDNLSQDTGAAVDLGNILFDGQTVIEDSIDVFNAEWQCEQVFHRNSVTFLNDLDNTIKGFNRSQDVINGQGGNDRIDGRSGNDLLRGGDGFDTLIGGKGDDTLVGGDGVDRLRGGKGDDLLDGGLGDDLFVLAANRGTDIVQDFTNGSDRFGLAGGLTFGQLTIVQSGSDTLISITVTNEVLTSLSGVNANLIGATDFTTA